jgi:hypothetical protein
MGTTTAKDLLDGAQCSGCSVPVSLPFPFTFYGQTYSYAYVSSEGTLHFSGTGTLPVTYPTGSSHTCPFPFPQLGPSILPYWSEFLLHWGGSGSGPCVENYGVPCGIYTSTSGSAPDRIYTVQWVGVLIGSNHETVNFEARLHESTGIIDFVYRVGLMFGSYGAVGVQNGAGRFTSYACNTSATLSGRQVRWTPMAAACASTTPTATPTQTPPSIGTNTPSATATPCTDDYTYTPSTGSIVPGTTLVSGSQCGQCVVPLALPFPFSFYGQTYTTTNVASNGKFQFATTDTSANSCPPNYPQLGPAILPNWDDSIDMAQTGICQSITGRPCGIYTSVSGSAPNRTFNIEWLGRRAGSSTYIANFELRLYEGTGAFDFLYGAVNPPGAQGYSSSIGIQDGSARFINYACHVANSIHQGLLIKWTSVECGPTVTPTPTVITTSTVTSTVTPTRQVTATACTITFTDVDETNVFYPFIRCLACRGIISGYDDGTFRPHNPITRGQISKIVSNAAGLADDPGDQLYEDVPPIFNPFYAWINRLSLRGYMGGYPCGTLPEEPCVAPDNRPYFRPGANANRGQLSKIVSNAAGIDDPASGQFYADVPEDHPFYLWIMRLTNLGVMSGYPCGGEGEPCDTENRPYFRPYNNVTRGQASKIIANTFFPGCQPSTR